MGAAASQEVPGTSPGLFGQPSRLRHAATGCRPSSQSGRDCRRADTRRLHPSRSV